MEQILGGRPSSWGSQYSCPAENGSWEKAEWFTIQHIVQEASNRHPHFFGFLTADVSVEMILVMFLPLGALSALRRAGEDCIPVQDGCARAQVDFFGSITLDHAPTSGSRFLPTG